MSYEGRLLISKPSFHDDSFAGTIIFIVEHDNGGAIGLILNRPSGLLVGDAFAAWESLVPEGEPIFSGGPVDEGAMVVLADGSFPEGDDDGEVALGLRSVDFEVQAPLMRADGVDRIRVFAGYTGWGSGQLESEMALGAWWIVEGNKADVFNDDPASLWKNVLRRSGSELAWFAHYPADPTLN